MSTLRVEALRAAVAGKEILHGVDLTVASGEIHAVMGPNGSGKSTLSHVLMGRPGYEVLGGSVTIDGEEMLARSPAERAAAGLFLALQYPVEVPGVSLGDVLEEAVAAAGGDRGVVAAAVAAEAAAVGLEPRLLGRSLNVDLSGGEKKRLETVQLAVLRRRFAILDEIDSGLDVDALRAVARRVKRAADEDGVGVIAITHYARLLDELRPDAVHVLSDGRIVASGGPELAAELERTGYAGYVEAEPAPAEPPRSDPFADPLA
ncbi:MAG TPA: Fe-S cluster assembly ATPase SufC [Acidimicrobiales bacterium]|nr:Fe-S cluster assembly ATPase SufC [Acidimicrobiales bacterium]